ncbi:hypothetical protein NDU88_001068 [Pleurodeles waltl]|uniref:Uncharacterized protein n=1 Tax=Pleurodeles waltl TaxID=8319 RepID=A0AAV7SY85_PLEWA|nr:hypothetical protein NDU88_001068 [Pleurodeles waltl]
MPVAEERNQQADVRFKRNAEVKRVEVREPLPWKPDAPLKRVRVNDGVTRCPGNRELEAEVQARDDARAENTVTAARSKTPLKKTISLQSMKRAKGASHSYGVTSERKTVSAEVLVAGSGCLLKDAKESPSLPVLNANTVAK